MAKTLQFRRGTTSELSSVTGAVGELFVDTTKDTVVVMDGSTAGGKPLATEQLANTALIHAQAAFNAANTGGGSDFTTNDDGSKTLTIQNETIESQTIYAYNYPNSGASFVLTAERYIGENFIPTQFRIEGSNSNVNVSVFTNDSTIEIGSYTIVLNSDMTWDGVRWYASCTVTSGGPVTEDLILYGYNMGSVQVITTTSIEVDVLEATLSGINVEGTLVTTNLSVETALVGDVYIESNIITPLPTFIDSGYGPVETAQPVLINGDLEITGTVIADLPAKNWVYLQIADDTEQPIQLVKNTSYIVSKDLASNPVGLLLPENAAIGEWVEIMIFVAGGNIYGDTLICTERSADQINYNNNAVYSPELFGEFQMIEAYGKNRVVYFIWDYNDIPSGKESAENIPLKFIKTFAGPFSGHWVLTI
jgi:hypothetical protein